VSGGADHAGLWPWLVLAGLGAFHGLNPAMGWLFAVGLGLHRQSRATVYLSLIPLALGHALSVGVVAGAFVATGVLVDTRLLRIGSGLLLIGWAAYHWRWGHRHRVRVGMQTGMLGLALWSFLMAGAHGAGLMLLPVLMPLCYPGGVPASGAGPAAVAFAGLAVHTAAMLAATALVAGVVYEWVGVAILRHAWINVDALWVAALALCGAWLVLTAL
jgi:hypothetical protein